jgi:hypothetical protein
MYPRPEYFANCFIGLIQAEKVFDYEEVLLMEFARRLMTDHVFLSCVIENRIGATETLKGTISAARQ